MAGRKVKPKEIPAWLTDMDNGSGHAEGRMFADDPDPRCIWFCLKCGAPFFYRAEDGAHGGPPLRDEDRRYAYAQGPCWRSKDYGVKCATPKEWRLLKHAGVDDPDDSVRARLAAYASEMRRQERERKRAER